MYRYKRNGFTLVELMAVIIIISLIALLTFPNIINQIKKTKKSNNKMIEDVVIEQAKKYVNDNKDELLEDEYCMPISTLIDNDYIKEDFVNINDIKDNKVVHITRTNTDSFEVMDKDKCVITPTAVKYHIKKTNPITVTDYTDGDIHEMYTFEHEATEQTPALTDYRYIGNDPNNYVEFNNELWRIIGVFKVEDENGKCEYRVKLIRDESLGIMQWNSNKENEWISSTIQLYLSSEYVIDSNYRNLMDNVKFYLGGNNHYQNGEELYKGERSNNTYDNRSKNWNGEIALMYISDYVNTYALNVDNICYETPDMCKRDSGANPNSSWLHKSYMRWSLTPNSESYRFVYEIYNNGMIYKKNHAGYSANIFPVVYLNFKVKIKSGDGTQSNPYQLSM